jgi:hypothetical protein
MIAILEAVDASVVRDQFETSVAFAQRNRDHDAALSKMLTEPITFLGWGGSGENQTFHYDADHGLMWAKIGRNGGVISDAKGNGYFVMSTPHEHMVLMMPSAPFLQTTPAPRRSVAELLNNPLGRRPSPSVALRSFGCTFPMSAVEARERNGHLSLLLSAPVETVLKRSRSLQMNESNRLSPYGLLTSQPPDKIGVWIVDVATRQRIAHGPLSACLTEDISFPRQAK